MKQRLSEFITLQRGFDLPASQRVLGEVPVVASTGIVAWHNLAKVKAPGVVIGRSGSIGGGQFVEQDFWPLNTTLYVKDFKGNNPRYAYYALKTIDFSAFNAGAGVPTLNRNHIASIEIEVLPRHIQDRIAGILSDYDSAIANCRKQIALLEEAAMRLYREWFKDGKGEKKKLCDVCDILYGKPHKDIPYGNIPIYGSAGIMRYGNKAKFAEESVLIPRKGTLDNVMYVDDPFWVVDTMFYTRFKISHMAKIAFYQLAKLKMSNMNTGTAVPSMTTETLYKLDLIVPPEELRKRFDELVSKLFSAKKRCLLQIRTLTEARDRLLPKLMKGEVAV